MASPNQSAESPATSNGASNAAASGAASTLQSNAPAWSANMSSFQANTGAPSFPQFSASTAAILERLQGKGNGGASGSAAFEAKRAEILQNYMTSDKLPTPPPIASTGKRGRGGRVATPSLPRIAPGPSPGGSGRGSGRGRGRGRGGRGGRGGKRKRSDSDRDDDDDDDNSDESDSYTPLTTRTKSGRSVNKPVAFVPVIPEPSQGVKRRKSAKTMLAAKCKTCNRDVDPSNNRIVFCDTCSTAYHQYCHNPPIDNEVVTVLEKEWLCAPCRRSKETVVAGTEELIAAEGLTVDEKRAFFNSLSHDRVVGLLLHASIRHPDLPIFPSNVRQLIPNLPPSTISQQPLVPSRFHHPQPPITSHSRTILSPPNGQTPRFSSTPDLDSAEAQLLDESHSNTNTTTQNQQQQQTPLTRPSVTMDLAGHQYEEDDGYDTDPPAHYPKPGNGLARTLRPESEDLNWLVDDNFEVFSHGWKGDGTGLGADGSLDGAGTKVV